MATEIAPSMNVMTVIKFLNVNDPMLKIVTFLNGMSTPLHQVSHKDYETPCQD